MRPVNPVLRSVAILLVALLLPVQGAAAACAQICAGFEAKMEASAATMDANLAHHGHEATPATEDGAPVSGHDHCGLSELGAGKCCEAHVFVVALPEATPAPAAASFGVHGFEARWASFFPEDPSPPPIAAFRA